MREEPLRSERAQVRDGRSVLEAPELAGPGAEKFHRRIEKAAFRVELHTDSSGKELLRWRGINDGNEVLCDEEPYVGFGTKAAGWRYC